MKLYNFKLLYLELGAIYESGIVQAKSEHSAMTKLERHYKREIESGLQIALGGELEFDNDGICVAYKFGRE